MLSRSVQDFKISGERILGPDKRCLDRGQEPFVSFFGGIGVQKEQAGICSLCNLPQHEARKNDAPRIAKNVRIFSTQEKLPTRIPARPGRAPRYSAVAG